jgi:hypothetical protein
MPGNDIDAMLDSSASRVAHDKNLLGFHELKGGACPQPLYHVDPNTQSGTAFAWGDCRSEERILDSWLYWKIPCNSSKQSTIADLATCQHLAFRLNVQLLAAGSYRIQKPRLRLS